jgi:hypothetical protein
MHKDSNIDYLLKKYSKNSVETHNMKRRRTNGGKRKIKLIKSKKHNRKHNRKHNKRSNKMI